MTSRGQAVSGTSSDFDGFRIRPYREDDRDSAYAVCLKTGDNGEDATHLYEDPHALGNIYVGPYLELEPEHAFVLEGSEGVCGYVLGALDTRQFYEAFVTRWLPPLKAVTPDPQGSPASWTADERIYHQIHHPRLDYPTALEPYPSHLHIDLLPRAQGRGWGRRMLETLLDTLRAKGSPGVHLGVGLGNERARGFYGRLGFEELFSTGTDDQGVMFMGRPL